MEPGHRCKRPPHTPEGNRRGEGKILLWVSVLMFILKKDELGAGIEQKGDAYEN